MEKADDALRTARREQDLSPSTAVNRAYYACFYAASAVLIAEGRKFVRHAGTRNAVHQFLVHKGRLPTELGTQYDKLMTSRHEADYEATVSWTPLEARHAAQTAERIVTALRALLPTGNDG
jgi:uncharacterized protein (UPF0332 family)